VLAQNKKFIGGCDTIKNMAEPIIEETGQTTLLDLSGKELNAYWVDEKQNLFIPNNPLHFKAHKLQVLLARLDKQLIGNPAQFNAATYKTILDEYTKCVEDISDGRITAHDSGDLADDGESEATSQMGDGAPPSVDTGVSADNPFARKRVSGARAVSVPATVS